MAARFGSSTPNGDLEERLSSLRLHRVWRSSWPPGCSILPFARFDATIEPAIAAQGLNTDPMAVAPADRGLIAGA
jgi:hypothetical protein